MTTFIYALKEPDTGEIRYIGKTNDPKRRFPEHVRNANKRRNYCERWIFSLREAGQKPILEIVDEAPYEFRNPIEAAYIQFFREQGCELVNGTPGGDGLGSGADHPAFGKKFSVEHCTKLSQSHLGYKHSAERNERQSKRMVGNMRSLGKNLGNTFRLGHRHSQETKDRMSVAHLGKTTYNTNPSLETRLKISASMKNYRAKKKEGLL